jgi:hypothetical protein
VTPFFTLAVHEENEDAHMVETEQRLRKIQPVF